LLPGAQSDPGISVGAQRQLSNWHFCRVWSAGR